MRCAGVDNVALDRARERGLSVMRVPAYDPLSISEHAAAMMMSLNRHLSESRDRLRLGNFSLNGLVGTSMRGKTVGIVGTGKIGRGFAKICRDGFQMRVLGFDKFQKDDFQGEYVSLDELYAQSDVISLHLPLTPETKGLINKKTIEKLKEGVILINTSRGALVEARAAIDGLVSGRIGALGLDVYENENKLFFKDFSSLGTKERMLAWDETMAILGSMPQVLVTPHTAFLTREALNEIATTTANNLAAFFAADAPLRGDSVVVDARE
ncbi:D-isomer specific 2-hydroxyacid dehydrogenase [Ostreococcus tauri]|uniref:D-isomer specific 2-hydroxyacid dehydrogenase n=1 Tax=Ostreococcus tauri TaxID=70448 RepID=A0A1Y5I1I9_OSTTA|nr:D-isomer specific 2-hydroxyacid dehydrogenase [Ostreococcus tauri]